MIRLSLDPYSEELGDGPDDPLLLAQTHGYVSQEGHQMYSKDGETQDLADLEDVDPAAYDGTNVDEL